MCGSQQIYAKNEHVKLIFSRNLWVLHDSFFFSFFFFGYFFKLGSRHYQPCLSSNVVSSNSLWHQFFKDANFVPFCFKFGKLLEWEYDIQLKCWLKILLVFFWVFFAHGISMIRALQIKVCHQSFMMTSRLPQCNFAWPQSIPNTVISCLF